MLGGMSMRQKPELQPGFSQVGNKEDNNDNNKVKKIGKNNVNNNYQNNDIKHDNNNDIKHDISNDSNESSDKMITIIRQQGRWVQAMRKDELSEAECDTK